MPIVEYLKFQNPETNAKIDWRVVLIERLPHDPLTVAISDFDKPWCPFTEVEWMGQKVKLTGCLAPPETPNPKYKTFGSEVELYDVYKTFYYLESKYENSKLLGWKNNYPIFSGSSCIGYGGLISYQNLLDENFEVLTISK